jgi:hypothetical protein
MGDKVYIQNFDGEILWKVATQKTGEEMRG